MDSSDFFSFLVERSSVRQYLAEDVPEPVVRYLLECASTGPSAGNLESWDVVVVRDPGLKEELCHAALSQEHVREAPLLLVVCANYIRSMSRYGERGILYALEDATIATTYLMLASLAAGLSSCWVGAFDDDQVRTVLDLPYHVRPVSILTLGYGTGKRAPSSRMPLDEHIHEDGW
jgi:nitroreductase